jgi:hypothetical protein
MSLSAETVRREAAELLAASDISFDTLATTAQVWSAALTWVDASIGTSSTASEAARQENGTTALAAILVDGARDAEVSRRRRLRRALHRAVVDLLGAAIAKDPEQSLTGKTSLVLLFWRTWHATLSVHRGTCGAAIRAFRRALRSGEGPVPPILVERATYSIRILRTVCSEARKGVCKVAIDLWSQVWPERERPDRRAAAAYRAATWLVVCLEDIARYEAEVASALDASAQRVLLEQYSRNPRLGFLQVLPGLKAASAAFGHGLWALGVALKVRPSRRALVQGACLWRSAGVPLAEMWVAALALSMTHAAKTVSSSKGGDTDFVAARSAFAASQTSVLRMWASLYESLGAPPTPPTTLGRPFRMAVALAGKGQPLSIVLPLVARSLMEGRHRASAKSAVWPGGERAALNAQLTFPPVEHDAIPGFVGVPNMSRLLYPGNDDPVDGAVQAMDLAHGPMVLSILRLVVAACSGTGTKGLLALRRTCMAHVDATLNGEWTQGTARLSAGDWPPLAVLDSALFPGASALDVLDSWESPVARARAEQIQGTAAVLRSCIQLCIHACETIRRRAKDAVKEHALRSVEEQDASPFGRLPDPKRHPNAWASSATVSTLTAISLSVTFSIISQAMRLASAFRIFAAQARLRDDQRAAAMVATAASEALLRAALPGVMWLSKVGSWACFAPQRPFDEDATLSTEEALHQAFDVATQQLARAKGKASSDDKVAYWEHTVDSLSCSRRQLPLAMRALQSGRQEVLQRLAEVANTFREVTFTGHLGGLAATEEKGHMAQFAACPVLPDDSDLGVWSETAPMLAECVKHPPHKSCSRLQALVGRIRYCCWRLTESLCDPLRSVRYPALGVLFMRHFPPLLEQYELSRESRTGELVCRTYQEPSAPEVSEEEPRATGPVTFATGPSSTLGFCRSRKRRASEPTRKLPSHVTRVIIIASSLGDETGALRAIVSSNPTVSFLVAASSPVLTGKVESVLKDSPNARCWPVADRVALVRASHDHAWVIDHSRTRWFAAALSPSVRVGCILALRSMLIPCELQGGELLMWWPDQPFSELPTAVVGVKSAWGGAQLAWPEAVVADEEPTPREALTASSTIDRASEDGEVDGDETRSAVTSRATKALEVVDDEMAAAIDSLPLQLGFDLFAEEAESSARMMDDDSEDLIDLGAVAGLGDLRDELLGLDEEEDPPEHDDALKWASDWATAPDEGDWDPTEMLPVDIMEEPVLEPPVFDHAQAAAMAHQYAQFMARVNDMASMFGLA